MGEVQVIAERGFTAPAEKMRAAVADYAETRRDMLTEHFSEYEVREGGQGAGTVVHWRLQATKKRVRDCLMDVSAPQPGTLVESDRNSSMVTTWTVGATGDGSTVRVVTTWQGAGGIGGFFERRFAPLGLRRIYDEMLGKLEAAVK
jgi:hypothetical protein